MQLPSCCMPLFDRVVLITPRESFAQDTALVTRQGIVRRIHEKSIETIVFAEPRWSGRFEDGVLEYANVYTGKAGVIEDVAFLAYSTPARLTMRSPRRCAQRESTCGSSATVSRRAGSSPRRPKATQPAMRSEMDFNLTPEQEAIRTAIARVCAAFDLEYWLQKDRAGSFPHDFHAALAHDGWLGIAMPASTAAPGSVSSRRRS